MDTKSHPELYLSINQIQEAMELPIQVTLYQEQFSYQNNIGIIFHQNEAHIVLSGRVLKLLDSEELKAVLSHELYHYYLFAIDDKSYEVTDRIITSIANDDRSEEVYLESARLFKLYTELYCDRGAYFVMKDINPIISSLVKLSTGIDKVNPESYLEQANEILLSDTDSTTQITHPENYIRAKALDLWAQSGYESNEDVEKFVEPKIEYEKLHLFSQDNLNQLTRNLISLILKPKWNQTSRILNLAKDYYPRFVKNDDINAEELFHKLGDLGESSKKYLSYVLLDFALADPALENVPLGYAFELAEYADMKEVFKRTVKKEVRLTERKFQDVQKNAVAALNEIIESKEDSLYGE